MSFFYESKSYQSEKNGTIRCIRLFGKWHVTVGGIGQTTPYVISMWRKSLRHIPKGKNIKKVLLLGLGAGGQVKTVYKKFPHAAITAIEWDPVMVDISKKFKFVRPYHHPNIMIGDAIQILPQLKQKFDLILVDIFTGGNPSLSLYDTSFINEIARKLDKSGYLILNVFRKPELFPIFDQVLSRLKKWRFEMNKLALYCPRGEGVVGDPLPLEYRSHKQSAIYLNGECYGSSNKYVVGKEGCLGLRWKVGPVWIESYESDIEPEITPFHAPRMVIWQPLTRQERIKTWRRSFIQMNTRCTGFTEVGSSDGYWKSWSSHAERHRKRWLREDRFGIESASLEEFCVSYRAASKLVFLKKLFITLIKNHYTVHPNLLHSFVARDLKTKKVVAGLAVLDLPDTSQSYHMISFIHPKIKNTSVGVGLIDFWFRHALENSFRFLNFGAFWVPGEPLSWKGFSKFKKQFGVNLINRPNPMFRIILGQREK